MQFTLENGSVMNQYTIATLDSIMAVISGFVALVWLVLGTCVGNYEEFKQ